MKKKNVSIMRSLFILFFAVFVNVASFAQTPDSLVTVINNKKILGVPDSTSANAKIQPQSNQGNMNPAMNKRKSNSSNSPALIDESKKQKK